MSERMRRALVVSAALALSACVVETDEQVGCAVGQSDGVPEGARLSGLPPRLSLTPTSLAFDLVTPGEAVTREVVAENVGGQVLVFDAVLLDGAQAFTPRVAGVDPRRRPETLVDPDGDGEAGLAPGAQFVIEITYAPSVDAPAEAQLRLWTNDLTQAAQAVTLRASDGPTGAGCGAGDAACPPAQ